MPEAEVATAATQLPPAVAELRTNLRAVFGNLDLRRVQGAFLGSVLGDWAYSTAIMVYAFHQGGAALLGIWAGTRLLLQSVAAPLGGVVADRMSRRSYLLANDAVRLALVLLVVALVAADASVVVVLVVATGVNLVGASFRPAQAGLIPRLVTSPDQLTAANATADVMESLAIFVGPALGGLLLMNLSVEWAVLVNGLSFVVSLVLVAGITRVDDRPAARPHGQDRVGLLRECSAGFRELSKDRDMVAFTGLLALNGALSGALNVLLVVVAAEVFGSAAAIGYLNSLGGVGTALGGLAVLGLATRLRLGRAMVVGILGWCLPLVAIGLVPGAWAVVPAMFVLGLSDPLVSVGYGTIPQRMVPGRTISRVFGALESAFIASMALGSFVVPWLLRSLSVETTAVVVGGTCAILALLCGTRMPHLDARLAPPPYLPLVRASSIFASQNPVAQEAVARQLEVMEVMPGQVVFTETEAGDRFYLIASGEVEITQGDRTLRREGAGDYFGEIALLRNVPRTATVTAVVPTVLVALTREDFLDAMSDEQAHLVVESTALKRLAA